MRKTAGQFGTICHFKYTAADSDKQNNEISRKLFIPKARGAEWQAEA